MLLRLQNILVIEPKITADTAEEKDSAFEDGMLSSFRCGCEYKNGHQCFGGFVYRDRKSWILKYYRLSIFTTKLDYLLQKGFCTYSLN